MIARLRRNQEESDKGFTLVELLVVIIIIGILSAVAVPVFLNQQKKAKDTSADSDVSTLGKEISAALVDADVDDITISQTGERYTMTIGATGTPQDLGRSSKDVILVDKDGKKTTSTKLVVVADSPSGETTLTSTNWCIAVAHPEGDKKVYSYSAENGIVAGENCAGTDKVTVTTP